jgi:FkbM family methyltransferase
MVMNLRDFRNFRAAYKNYFSLFLRTRIRLKKNFVYGRNGTKALLENMDDLFRYTYISLHPNEYQNESVVKKIGEKELRLKPLQNGDIFRAFIQEDYKELSIENKIVIDVGASVGDSAIYFAARGASHIYAFEPYLKSYIRAKENISLNGFDKQITIVNKAVGTQGIVELDPSYNNNNSSTLNHVREGGVKVDVLSLQQILEEYNIKQGVLKMDCEGCEYEAILSASSLTLRKFSEIKLEYHYGCQDLVSKLKDAGFLVKFSGPLYMKSRDICSKNQFLLYGYIYARQ